MSAKLYPVPPFGVVTSCRSCGAAIVWGWTENKKNVPLSVHHPEARYDPDPAGVCVEAPSHFVDCVNASKHSKKGKST